MIVSNWKWPTIPGLHSFQGELVHSASWKDDLDLKGKTVAVLGNGSSGIQIVSAIQNGIAAPYPGLISQLADLLPDVKELVTFIRSPTWITAGFAQKKAGGGGSNFKCDKRPSPSSSSHCRVTIH
jgi:hypothetical protein